MVDPVTGTFINDQTTAPPRDAPLQQPLLRSHTPTSETNEGAGTLNGTERVQTEHVQNENSEDAGGFDRVAEADVETASGEEDVQPQTEAVKHEEGAPKSRRKRQISAREFIILLFVFLAVTLLTWVLFRTLNTLCKGVLLATLSTLLLLAICHAVGSDALYNLQMAMNKSLQSRPSSLANAEKLGWTTKVIDDGGGEHLKVFVPSLTFILFVAIGFLCKALIGYTVFKKRADKWLTRASVILLATFLFTSCVGHFVHNSDRSVMQRAASPSSLLSHVLFSMNAVANGNCTFEDVFANHLHVTAAANYDDDLGDTASYPECACGEGCVFFFSKRFFTKLLSPGKLTSNHQPQTKNPSTAQNPSTPKP